MISILVFVFTWTAMADPPSPDCPVGQPVGKVTEIQMIEGQPAQIRRATESTWTDVRKGAGLCVGDQIRTRFRTRARVALKNAITGQEVDVIVGVNARIRTVGSWVKKEGTDAILDVVHGVVRLSLKAPRGSSSQVVRTGPSLCKFSGDYVLANWDPFKREANYLVESGRVSCSFEDSTISLEPGQSVEIVRGMPDPVRPSVPLILDSFVHATEID